jgi:predicted flap endonuclease-1-like 5' DNA nuclease
MFRKGGITLTLLLVGLALSGFSSPAAVTQDDGNPWWIWLLVLLALVIFAAIVIWMWMRSSDEEEVLEDIPSRAGQIEEIAPAPVAPDDLKLIEGIGPKISGVLQAAGISAFAQLAATGVDRLREILEEADPNLLRLADPATWPEQAGLAAAGKWEALESLQDELKGGRRE